MLLDPETLNMLGPILRAERERQKLTREQAAAVCGVSPSFIRDAEDDPGTCSLGKLAQLFKGLGLALDLAVPTSATSGRSDSVAELARDTDLGAFPTGNRHPVFRHEKFFNLGQVVSSTLSAHIASKGLPGVGQDDAKQSGQSTGTAPTAAALAAKGINPQSGQQEPPSDKTGRENR